MSRRSPESKGRLPMWIATGEAKEGYGTEAQGSRNGLIGGGPLGFGNYLGRQNPERAKRLRTFFHKAVL